MLELFRVDDGKLSSIKATRVGKEKTLQNLLEANLHEAFRIRFLDTEYGTGQTHGGRIDTLGIDENDTPVIIEYKRSADANVVMQALYYLDWLVDHRAEFEKLVSDKLGLEAAGKVDWSAPRVICIAESYTKFDRHAVSQMGREIELVEYTLYPDGYLTLDLIAGGDEKSQGTATSKPKSPGAAAQKKEYSAEDLLSQFGDRRTWAEDILEYAAEMGPDVSVRPLKVYIAIRTSKNFATISGTRDSLTMAFHLEPTAELLAKYASTRDVSSIGHWGTGDLQLSIRSDSDVVSAKELLDLAYATRTGGA